MTTTILMGNGIGMAVDSKYFTLESGINSITEKLTEEERNIICFNKTQMPKSEDELEDHHKILSACHQLIKFDGSLNCLNDVGKKFPNIYQNFIYQVAKYFYDYEYEGDLERNKFNLFIDNLIKYLNNNRCHIATLNYDKLLYQALIEKDILKGYDGLLVDGIYANSSGFEPVNMIPIYEREPCFGWYMHLHGSPIFKTLQNGTINKCTLHDLPDKFSTTDSEHNHIVLANTKLKPYIIANSKLLDSYFNFFVKALLECDTLILFGYSGCDEHINFEIKERLLNKNKDAITIKIIECNININQNEREKFWKDKLCPVSGIEKPLQLKIMSNILEYDFKSMRGDTVI